MIASLPGIFFTDFDHFHPERRLWIPYDLYWRGYFVPLIEKLWYKRSEGQENTGLLGTPALPQYVETRSHQS